MPNHHYVSKLYYKNFAFNPAGSLVYAMDYGGNIINRPKSIRRISFEEDYNTPEQEQEQSRLETKYREILREFIETPNPGNSNLSRDFVNFVCFLMGNNIYIRKKLDERLSEIEFQIANAPGDHNISTHRGHRGRFDWSKAFACAVYEEFRGWQFVRRETNGYQVFITSDDPVSILNPEDVRIPVTTNIVWKNSRIVNIGDESTQNSDDRVSREIQIGMTLKRVSFGRDVVMIFPVSPSICLLGFSNSTRHLRFMNRTPRDNNDILAFMNLITFSQCNKVVYSHSKDLLNFTKIDMPKFLQHCQCHGCPPSFDTGIA